MKSFVSFKIAVILMAALFCASFFSCSSGDGSGAEADPNMGRVVFSVSKGLADSLRASSAGVSKALEPSFAEAEDIEMEIKLVGGAERTETIAVKEGATVSFSDIPIGVSVKASGVVYKKQGESSRHILYEGETDFFVVLAYTPVNLNLRRFYYITYDLKGGSWASLPPPSGRYQKGGSFSLPTSNALSYPGWVFAGWCTSDDGGQTLQKFTFTNETKGDFTLYAKWVESAVQGISVTVDRDASDIEISYEAVDDPAAGPCVRFTATTPELPEGADSFAYDWLVDNRRVEGFAAEYLFVKTGMAKDVYDVSVRVNAMTGDGNIIKTWSAFAQVKVE